MKSNLIIFCAPHSILNKTFFDGTGEAGSPAPLKIIEFMPSGFDETHVFIYRSAQAVPRQKEKLEKKYNIHIHYVSENRIIGAIQQVYFYFRLFLKKRGESFYCYGMGYNSIASYFSARITRQKSILRLFGTFLYEYVSLKKKSVWTEPKRCIELISLKLKHDKVVITDDGTGGSEVLNALSIPEHKKMVCYNGLDIYEYTEVDVFNNFVNGSENIFVSVSRLAKWKRIDLVLNFFAKIIDSNVLVEPKLVIVGFGQDLDTYVELAKSLEISDYVLFTGGLKTGEVNSVLAKSKYFISFYEAGNVGNTLLEAMRLGCIPIVRNTGLTAKTIVNGHNGFCLPGSEVELLKAANATIKAIVERDKIEMLQNVKQFSDININTWKERINKEIVFIKR